MGNIKGGYGLFPSQHGCLLFACLCLDSLIAIGNPGKNAPVIEFGSAQLGGMLTEEEHEEIRRVQELDFELDEDASAPKRGWVNMRDVETVLHSVSPNVRMCYTRALETNPDLKGEMILNLTLGPSGQMTAVTLDMTSSTITESAHPVSKSSKVIHRVNGPAVIVGASST